MAKFNIETAVGGLISDVKNMDAKMDAGFKETAAAFNAHVLKTQESFADVDRRLIPVEGTRKIIVWLSGTILVAVLTGLADFLVNHVKGH